MLYCRKFVVQANIEGQVAEFGRMLRVSEFELPQNKLKHDYTHADGCQEGA